MTPEGRMTMRHSRTRSTTARRALALAAVLAATVLAPLAGPAPELAAQEVGIASSSMTVSADVAELELQAADGTRHAIRFADGTVTVDGEAVGSYEPGGELARAWRSLLAESLSGETGFQLDAARLRDWEPPAGGTPDATAEALASALDRILGSGATPEETEADTGEAVSMTAGGDQLAIAPGRLSVDELVDRLGRLRSSLSRLGEDAHGAAEDLALVVHDDYALPADRTVDGNLALLGGELRLGSEVRGNVLLLDGTLILEPRARVDGDVLQVGGEVRREGGRVAGQFLSIQRVSPEAGAPTPPPGSDMADRIGEEVRESLRDARERSRPGFFARTLDNVGEAIGGVIGVIGILLLLGLGGALGVYFVRPQLEVVADTARHSFGRAFGVGLAGQILFGPVLFVLVVAVVTWLVIPFYVVATILAGIGGYLAVAHAAGEVLARQRYRYEWMERLRRSNSYYYVFSGLAALMLPFALAEALHLFGGWLGFLRGMLLFVGWVLTWLAASVGLGAVLLSRGGQRRDYARPVAGARRSAGVADETA